MRVFSIGLLALLISNFAQAKTGSDVQGINCKIQMGGSFEQIHGMYEVKEFYNYWKDKEPPSSIAIAYPTTVKAKVEVMQKVPNWRPGDAGPKYALTMVEPTEGNGILPVIDTQYGPPERRFTDEEHDPLNESVFGFNEGGIRFRHRLVNINGQVEHEYSIDFSKASFEEVVKFYEQEKTRALDIARNRGESFQPGEASPLAFSVEGLDFGITRNAAFVSAHETFVTRERDPLHPLATQEISNLYVRNKPLDHSITSASDISFLSEDTQRTLLIAETLQRIVLNRGLFLTGEDAGAAYNAFETATSKEPGIAQTYIETLIDERTRSTMTFGNIKLIGVTTSTGVSYAVDLRSVKDPEEILNFVKVIAKYSSATNLRVAQITKKVVGYGLPTIQNQIGDTTRLQRAIAINKDSQTAQKAKLKEKYQDRILADRVVRQNAIKDNPARQNVTNIVLAAHAVADEITSQRSKLPVSVMMENKAKSEKAREEMRQAEVENRARSNARRTSVASNQKAASAANSATQTPSVKITYKPRKAANDDNVPNINTNKSLTRKDIP